MISIGLFSLRMATTTSPGQERAHRTSSQVPRSLAALRAGLISTLGILALLAVIFRY